MKRLGRAALLAALLGGAGCYKATFIRDSNAVKGEEHDKWLDFWLLGLVNEQDWQRHTPQHLVRYAALHHAAQATAAVPGHHKQICARGFGDIDVKQFCPDGRVAQVVTGGNFGSGIVTFLTLGIYAPRKVYVTCATDGRALQLELDEHGKLVAFAEVKR